MPAGPRDMAGTAAARPCPAEPRTRLVALSEHLEGQFDVLPTDAGLIVRDQNRPGNVLTITCCPRPEDNDRLWFYGSYEAPIAEVDHIPDTVVAIKGHLAERLS